MSLEIDPGTFENPHGVSAWTGDGATLTQSSAQKHSGTYSALLTVVGTPPQAYMRAYGASAVPVTPGVLYQVTMWVRGTGDVLPAVDWYDSGGNYIGGEYPSAVTLVPATWTPLQVTTLAPVGAASMTYGPTQVTPTNGQTLYVDDVFVDFPGGAFVATATLQDAWPPRVQIAVTGLVDGDQVEIYRQVSGSLTLIRGGVLAEATDPAFIVIDAEFPFGVPVSWVVYVNGVAETVAGDTYELPGGKVAISDAITGLAAEVVIANAGDRAYARTSARFRVAGRNMVVAGPMGQAEGTYELLVETTSAFENLRALVRSATQGILQIRQPGVSASTGDPYDGIDAYLAVDKATERRFSQDGSDPRRLVTIDYAETDGWAGSVVATGFTLQDIADYMDPGDTLTDLSTLYAGQTLLQIALADWTP